MQFETFRGRNVQEALAAVKSALGDGAVIGSTKQIDSSARGLLGRTLVEVTAAPGRATSSRPSRLAPALEERRTAASPAAARRPVRSSGRTSPPDLETLSADLHGIRALLEQVSQGAKPRDRARAMMSTIGVEEPLATSILGGASRLRSSTQDSLKAYVRTRLATRITIMDDPLLDEQRQIIACVGPTGVGKTTTLAKIAAHAHLERGRSVAIITLDTYRVGAVEQMRRFAQLIGVPMEVARDRTSFASALLEHNADVVLVDTAGSTGVDATSAERLADCMQAVAGRRATTLLALPCSIRGRDAERIVRAYAAMRPDGLVMTKLDEAEQVGGLLHAMSVKELPLAYVCDGPRVPEDIHAASHDLVLDALLKPMP